MVNVPTTTVKIQMLLGEEYFDIIHIFIGFWTE